MNRLLLWAALLVVAFLWLRRALGRGPSNRETPSRRPKQNGAHTLVCGSCSTRYDPRISGGVCPRCGK